MRLKSVPSLKGLAVLTGSVLIFLGACSSGDPNLAENISVQKAYELMQDHQSNTDFVVLDIRTPEEYAAGYVEDAINMDYYAADFEQQLDKLDKNQTYLVYCRTANRSGQAMPIFEELGFKTVYNMLGGIVAWQAAGYPIVGLTQISM